MGQSTSASGAVASGSASMISGRPNASVLPLPVGLFAITSVPSSAAGTHSHCTANGSVMPVLASAAHTSSLTPRAWKLSVIETPLSAGLAHPS